VDQESHEPFNSEKIQYVYQLEMRLTKEYTTEKRSNRKCRLSLLFQNVNHSRNICNRREAPPLIQGEGYLSKKEPINYHYLSAVLELIS